MKISKLFVGIIALSLAAAAAQAAPSSANLAGPSGPGCICFTDPAGAGVCGIGTACAGATLCAAAGDPICGVGKTCIDGSSSCCGFTHCNDDCPAGNACSNPGTCAGGLQACGAPPKPEDCSQAVPAGTPVTPCNDTTPTGPLGLCTSGGGVLDKWVYFVAPATSTRVRTDLNSTGSDSDYIVWDACPPAGNRIGCSEDEAPPYLGNICVGGLTVGATYYVQLGTWADGCPNGPYVVDIEPAGTCGNGIIDCGETCDPPGPCCSATCQDAQTCGDNVRCGTEQCDGTDDTACPGLCSANCTCNLPVCGDNIINQVTEECDGTATPGCPAGSYCATNCLCIEGIPAVSEWGLAVLTLIGLVSGTILFGRRRAAAH